MDSGCSLCLQIGFSWFEVPDFSTRCTHLLTVCVRIGFSPGVGHGRWQTYLLNFPQLYPLYAPAPNKARQASRQLGLPSPHTNYQYPRSPQYCPNNQLTGWMEEEKMAVFDFLPFFSPSLLRAALRHLPGLELSGQRGVREWPGKIKRKF